MFQRLGLTVAFLSLGFVALSGCGTFGEGGGIKTEAKYPTGADRAATGNDIYAKPQSIFGKDGVGLFTGDRSEDDGGSGGIGVNGYLWRAALDTVSFMPLESADPFGGTILTAWYEPPESSGERLKLNVFITGKRLRADALRVRVFRQVRKGGAWKDAAVDPDTARGIEDAILNRARQFRVSELAR